MGAEEALTAPRARWQNPFVERLIGSIRRESLEHVIIWNERRVRRHLQRYVAYYYKWRTHLSLDNDAPIPRATQPPPAGRIVELPEVSGLHHHHERRAALHAGSHRLTRQPPSGAGDRVPTPRVDTSTRRSDANPTASP